MTEDIEWNDHFKKRGNEMLIFSLLIVLSSIDISLTLYGLANGFIEGNPFVALLMGVSIPFAIAIKYAVVFLPAVIVLIFMKKQSRYVVSIGMLVSVVLMGFVVLWNVMMLLNT